MKKTVDQHDSGQQPADAAFSSQPAPSDSQAPTAAYEGPRPDSPTGEADENEKTIISGRPAAAPSEFYQSVPLAKLATLLEGRRLDHFVVERMIGGGGMGAVFRGRDERLDRPVAIKVVPAARRDAETMRRFRLEAQAAAKLDHPNIARVYYVGETEEWNYIVFEFIDGVNLRDLVSMHGPLSIDDAVFYTRQVAEALEHAHQRGVVHRDIKPSNILITASGMVKVVDMGLARQTAVDRSSADETASGVTLGTFDYIAPEQARNPRDADVRSDLYSLGCTLFYMLTGHPPFPEGTALQKLLNHGSLPPPDPRQWRDDISDQLYAIMMKMMAKQPAHRYQRPIDLVNDLMLLAQLEDLPRSQSPGTIMVAPVAAQRSLLEANLPWVIALAFLLGTALWLQVQDMSSRFNLPGLNVGGADGGVVSELGKLESDEGADASAAASRSAPLRAEAGRATEAKSESTSDLALPDRPVGLQSIVVAADRVQAAGQRWAASLEQACRELQADPALREILVRDDIVISQPLRLEGRRFLIRGDADTLPTIQIPADVLRAAAVEGQPLIEVRGGGELDFEHVQMQIELAEGDGQGQMQWTRLSAGAKSSLRDCRVTVRGKSSLTRKPPGTLFSVAPGARQPTEAGGPSRVTIERSVIRGDATVVAWQVPDASQVPLEFHVRASLVAVSGSLLHVAQTSNPLPESTADKTQPTNVGLVLQDSTFYTSQPLLMLDYGGAASPIFVVTRTAHRCVFAAPPGSVLVALQRPSFDDPLGAFNWGRLSGRNNYYDASIRALCSCRDDQGAEIFVFSFTEGSKEGWFTDEAFQRTVPWRRANPAPIELSSVSESDFQLQESSDSVGFPGIGRL